MSDRDLSQNFKIASLLGFTDIKQRYQRSKLGVFWITISMAILITTMWLVFSNIFGTKDNQYLTYIAIGIVIWGYINSTISESCQAFISSESLIKQLSIPFYVYILRVILRNLIILGHNAIIIIAIYIYVGFPSLMNVLIGLFGLLILTINLAWIGIILSFASTRFRDVTQIISNVIQIAFYLTPVFWNPGILKDKKEILLINPLYYTFETIRGPLMGREIESFFTYITLIIAAIGITWAFMIYKKNKNLLAYWL
jgi:ABC-type polysaccharide/polyol phosphate export permease